MLLAEVDGEEADQEGEPPTSTNPLHDLFQQVTREGLFAKEQKENDRLRNCWSQVMVLEGKQWMVGHLPDQYFKITDGLLYYAAQRRGEVVDLLVVPRTKVGTVLELARTHPMSGHLGACNTLERVRDRFHWPGIEAEVKNFCQRCPICQHTASKRPPPAPLVLLPLIEVPLEIIGMDLVGPLPKSARGHHNILVLVDYATRYPEAVPLQKATTKAVVRELFLLVSQVDIHKDLLTEQGTPLLSPSGSPSLHLCLPPPD